MLHRLPESAQAFIDAYQSLCAEHGLMFDGDSEQDTLTVIELGSSHPEFVVWTDEAKEQRVREIEMEATRSTASRLERIARVRSQIGQRRT